jgi:glycogen operon protein
MLSTLMVSQGVPMLLSGDECRRTQRGNNNAYCQDNEISWFDWNLVEQNEDLLRFARSLIEFRTQEPTVRRTSFLDGRQRRAGLLPDVSWFDADGRPIDWTDDDPALVCLLGAAPVEETGSLPGRHVLLMIHGAGEPRPFVIPPSAQRLPWRLFFDTAAESPHDIYPDHDGPLSQPKQVFTMVDRSMMCFVAERRDKQRS